MIKSLKILPILLVIVAVGLSGCGSNDKSKYQAEKPFEIIGTEIEADGHKDIRYGMTSMEVISLLGDQGLVDETESGVSYSYELEDVSFASQINAHTIHYVFSTEDKLVTVTVDAAYAEGVTPDYLGLKKEWAEKIDRAGIPLSAEKEIPEEIFTQGILNGVAPYFALWEDKNYGITYFFIHTDGTPEIFISESVDAVEVKKK